MLLCAVRHQRLGSGTVHPLVLGSHLSCELWRCGGAVGVAFMLWVLNSFVFGSECQKEDITVSLFTPGSVGTGS